jgi:hypothetical protein
MSCCDDGICAAHGHAGKSGTKSPSAEQEIAPKECQHGKPSGMIACQLSCCQSHDYPVTGAVLFVLPDPLTILAAVDVNVVELKSQSQAMARLFEPPSPPPRSYYLIA